MRDLRKYLLSDKEILAMGYVRTDDGALLDNRDGFYNEHDSHIKTYDRRTREIYNPETHVIISRGLWEKIAASILEAPCLT